MEVNAMTLAVEEEFDSVVDKALSLHPLAHAGGQEKIHGALLQNAGPDSLLGIFAALGLDDDRFDTAQMEQVGQQESSRAGSDDADLRTYRVHSRFLPGGRIYSYAAPT
jgi:hypothetical protein